MRAEERKPGRKWALPVWTGFLFLWAMSGGAVAQQSELEKAVKQDAERQVKAYAGRRGWVNFEYQVEPWVPGSGEQHCEEPVNVASTQETGRPWGRVPYVISCPEPVWEIRARADVSLAVPVVTARRNISRGEILDHQTMGLKILDLGKIYGDFVTDRRLLAGQRTRRAIRGGQAITLDQAVAPLLVERGDKVVIRVSGDGVEASMRGEALQGGSRGQSVRVRNLSSGKVITAWPVEKGIVETHF